MNKLDTLRNDGLATLAGKGGYSLLARLEKMLCEDFSDLSCGL